MESKKGQWGPDNSPGMSVIFSAPYVGAMNQIAVELNWANGKNWVGAAANQIENRTSAQAIKQIRERWFGPGATNCENYFLHCEAEMDNWIVLDRESGGPLSGSVAGKLKGFPADLNEWRELAGMSLGEDENTREEDDDTYFTGDIENSGEYGDEDVVVGPVVLDLSSGGEEGDL